MEKKKIFVKSPITKGVAKVPVVMQMEALECGAASLAMVLAYYGKWVPLEQVRLDCGVSRDGSNAKLILMAARNYGLIAKGYRYEPERLKKVGKFPCIIHWNFNHFVVLNGFRKNAAVLNDPARGRVTVSMEEFDQSFTGICILFEQGENFVPSGRKRSVVGFARKRLTGTGAAFALVVLTTLITSITGIINPGFARVLTDRLLTGENPEWLTPFIMMMLGLAVLQIIALLVKALYTYKIEGKLAIVANSTFIWHVIRLPMEFFSQRMAGDISSRAATNETIASTLINTLAPLVLNSIMLVLYFIVMLNYSLILTAVGLASIIINMFVAMAVSSKRINITRVQMRDSGKLSGTTANGIEMIETIKASGAENGFFEKWAGYQASVNSQTVNYSRLNEYIGAIPGIVSEIADIAILIIGVYLTMQGQFTVGMILAFQGFMESFSEPADELITATQTIAEMRTDMERVEDVMNYRTDVKYTPADISKNTSYDKLSGAIEMKNVTFGYSRLAPPLIENFSMTLKPGSSVAFVGSSGCGKSTITKLISGLYMPWSGEILFDGKPREKISHEVFTGSLAVVDQDIIMFEDTIANNIKMWDNSIEDFEMIMAGRDACIHEDIMLREGGYQCKLLENGKNFSGGQLQRIEIARVLAQDPTVIIMDEATSALDAKTEYEVVKAIKDRGITCIIVAHRLSTIRDCDEIVVLDRGKVIERGTHDELFAKKGLYTQLISCE